uniref:PARP n=1 Tax=Pyrodinium bahamense TaxID=73915 RepID=A0A7S0FJ54_9DINO
MADKTYRIEAAPSGRSSCTVSKAKIEKGELRLGSLVNFGGKGTYKWRKLPCITAKQASNIKKEVGGPGYLDGFSELTVEQQALVLGAFEAAAAGVVAAPAPSALKDDPAAKPKMSAGDTCKAKTWSPGTSGSGVDAAFTAEIIGAAHMAIDLAKAGDWAGLYKVLESQKGLVNVRPEVREYSVLHQAAYHGNLKAVVTLIDAYGADATQRTKLGKTVIDIAKQQGHTHIVETLAQQLMAKASKCQAQSGASGTSGASSSGSNDVMPLTPCIAEAAHKAIDLAKAGDWARLYQVLDMQKCLVNLRPEVREYGILHQAAFHGNVDAVAKLIDTYGADPTQRTKLGKTVIDIAELQGHAHVAECVALRLTAQTSKSKEAAMPLELTPEKMPKDDKSASCYGESVAQASKAASHSSVPGVTHTAHRAIDLAKAGHWEDLFPLLDVRGDIVNTRPDVREYAVLHQAVYHGNKHAVVTLVDKYGADPNQRTKLGKTPADVATEEGHVEVAAFLASRGGCASGSSVMPIETAHSAVAVQEEEDDCEFELVQMPDGAWKVSGTSKGDTAGSQAAGKRPGSLEGGKMPVQALWTASSQYEESPPPKKTRVEVEPKAHKGTGDATSSSSSGGDTSASSYLNSDALVDAHFPEAAAFRVHHSDEAFWSCRLTRTGSGSSGQLCTLQLLQAAVGRGYCIWTRWGSSDAKCQHKLVHYSSLEEAMESFQDQFLARTGNRWEDRTNFKPFFGKYIFDK